MKYPKPFPLVCVFASDWCCYDEETDIEDEHELLDAWISGLLIQEDDKKLVLSPFYFPLATKTRRTMVISKHSIKRMIKYR